jgi:protein-disulfide isomerase
MRRLFSLVFVCSLLFTVASAQTITTKAADSGDKSTSAIPAANIPSEATVNSFLQQTFGYEKDLTWKISSIRPGPVAGLAEVVVVLAQPQGQQVSRLFITPDGQHALIGDLIPFGAKPFEPAKKMLEKGITGPSRGPKDATVTVVEFGDLQCPACKAAQPGIEAMINAEPTVRFVFQNFPLEMHNWAAKGAAYADCVGRASNDAFWKFIAKTYETQGDITAANADEKLTALADGTGVKGADIAACAIAPDTKARVDASLALGKLAEVSGTPTLFINGRKIGNVGQIPADTLKALVDFAGK